MPTELADLFSSLFLNLISKVVDLSLNELYMYVHYLEVVFYSTLYMLGPITNCERK